MVVQLAQESGKICTGQIILQPIVSDGLPTTWVVSSAVEHCLHTAGVTGSNPVPPTNKIKDLREIGSPFFLVVSQNCPNVGFEPRHFVTALAIARNTFRKIFSEFVTMTAVLSQIFTPKIWPAPLTQLFTARRQPYSGGKSAPSVVDSQVSKSFFIISSFFRARSSAALPSNSRSGGASDKAASMIA